jgi:hypothetical protein
MEHDGERQPDLRVSDAERDAVVTELGRHFQVGRLDEDEFDQRVGSALVAKTRSDLDALLTDLPRPIVAGPTALAGSRSPRPRALAIVPLLVIAAFIATRANGSWHHGWPFAPLGFLWLIVPILFFRALARGRRRQWR